MLTKRIIACLDVKNGRTVKGLRFENLKDAGDAIELGRRYSLEGIDELVYLDIAATVEERGAFTELVERIACELEIPFTVGGGIKALSDVERLLRAGADKISVNSAALNNPKLISQMAQEFGSQCVVVAIDSKDLNGTATVFKNAGQVQTEWKTIDWAMHAAALGAGEILLTAIDRDGSKSGFHCELTCAVSEQTKIPIIASGGAGTKEHFSEVFQKGKADAALAASIFHFGTIQVADLKSYLAQQSVLVRL